MLFLSMLFEVMLCKRARKLLFDYRESPKAEYLVSVTVPNHFLANF